MAVDTETTGLNPHDPKVQLTHISHWSNEGRGTAFSVEDCDKLRTITRACYVKATTKLMFNAKFDIRMLAKRGVKIRGKLIDVMLMAKMVVPDEKWGDALIGLKHLARKYLKDPFIEEVKLTQWLRANKLKKKDIGLAPEHIVIPYALADAKRTLELFYFFESAIDEHNMWHVVEREMELMKRVVLPMEQNGICLVQAGVEKLRIKTTKAMQDIKDQLTRLTGDPEFNPNSHPQVAKHFYTGDIKPQRFSRKTGKPSTDTIALLQQPSLFGTLVSKYRKISKAQTTYLKNFTGDILRVNFNQGGARTGRFSSSGPNLQNIPRPDESSLLGQMRRCFVARPGRRLVFIDYEQIELRLTAHFSQEPHMLEAIHNGEDLHGVTCRLLFNKTPDDPDWKKFRYLAKTLNFAIVYGTGPETFRETILKDTDGTMRLSIVEAAHYINDYKAKHPNVVKLFDDVAREVADTGGVVNAYGRFMPVDPHKVYVGVNYKIQGTAADIIKRAMFKVNKILKGRNSLLVLQVHDELAFDMVSNDRHLIPYIVRAMEVLDEFSVPLTCSVEIGKNWHDKKELKIAC